MAKITCIGILVADLLGRPINRLPERGKLVLIPQMELHVGGGANNTGVVLKKLGEELSLPKSVLYRKKMGFGVPIKFWFCSDKFSPLLEKILFDGSLEERGYFNQNYLRNIVGEHLKGKKDHTHRIWTVFWLELWHRMFIDNTLKKDETLKKYL